MSTSKTKIEVGSKYRRLTVIKESGRKRGAILYLCKCDCGSEKEVIGYDLRNGKVVSCGCFKRERLKNLKSTHGLSHHRLYNTYYNMVERCGNENDPNYNHYGGRGIKVCEEWLDDFMSFYNWSMENGYSDKLTIDRTDNNGNYEPNNCRWVTQKEQNENRRANRYVDIDGVIKSFSKWCEIYQINYQTALLRAKKGMSDYEAITTPVRKKKEE
jgi:hypothetical protein